MLSSHRLPIRIRLALLYTGLLAVALAVFGAGVFFVLRNELDRSFDQALVSSAEHASDALGQEVGSGGQFDPSSVLLNQLVSTGGRAVVLDASGRVLIDSAPDARDPLPITSSDLEEADADTHTVSGAAPDGASYRLTVEPVLGPDGTTVGYIAWASSTEDLQSLLQRVLAALVIGGLVIVVIAFAAGSILARGALAPVADVTDTARAIALSGDFTARVEGGQPGDEVGDLAVAFNEMLAALEANHLALQRFLGDASHQLRSPLTTVRASLDLAVRPGLDEAERIALLTDAKGEAERMARLVADLLSLARAESGVRLEFAPVELDAVLVDAVRQHRQASSHVRMSLASVEPAIVDGDRDRLRELLGILLENAARYTPAGGTVTAGLAVVDGRAVATVSDTGIGLDSADRAHLFERLYRGARAREMRPSGTGLGLTIAQWIVEAHGGTIELGAREGGGTVASVSLPLRTP